MSGPWPKGESSRCSAPASTSPAVPEGKAWKQGQYLPNGYELAKYLAGIFYFPEETDLNLLRVSQYVVAKEGLGPLYDELRKLFNENYPATPVHEFFARSRASSASRARRSTR